VNKEGIMALKVVKSPVETLLGLDKPDEGLYELNHIFEPEFHQDVYVNISKVLSQTRGAFQLASHQDLVGEIHRGIQPHYVDDESDPSTLFWRGMSLDNGDIVTNINDDANICALKSICIRYGYIDLGTARSVSKEFYLARKDRAGVQRNDVLINSTGDGTIGRVAVFNYDFPAVVDGHITILRFEDPDLAWYIAGFLLSRDGQRQIYRYINGSSGQVEIYPQDIGRLWIKPASVEQRQKVALMFRAACEKHDAFRLELKKALSLV
jgi:type I restriction enzyme M protein